MLSNCKKEAKVSDPQTPVALVSQEVIKKIEEVKGFYTDALDVVNKKGSEFKSSFEKINEVERMVVAQCAKNFGQDFENSYLHLKNLKQPNVKSDGISEYFKEAIREMNIQVANLFEGEATPTEEEMIVEISNKIEDLKMLIASDFQLTYSEKSYLVYALSTQSILLSTTFEILNMALQDLSNKDQILKSWLSRAWRAVYNFVSVVWNWVYTSAILTWGDPIGMAIGAILGLGSAIYCAIYGWDYCICSPLYCFFEFIAMNNEFQKDGTSPFFIKA